MTTDGELLRRYTESASEEAFGELVRRHLDLVYAAALRQVNRDTALAQDVAQSVFTDLARKARQLTRHATLAGWLYTSAHFAAAKAVRSERRRQTHEQEAHTLQALLRDSGPDPDWEKLFPVIDSAMQELSEADRDVILLRYFENRPHAGIGEQIGLGENAARMRVERALEKLRAVLARRGMTIAAGLAAALAANAVTAAPVGLAAAITAASTLAAPAALAATQTIAMTMMQKILITIVVAGAVSAGIYGTLQASRQRSINQALQQTQAGQIQQLQRERDDASNQLAALTAENKRLRAGQQAAGVMKLRGEVGALRQSLANANRPATGLAKMMNDPALKDFVRQAQLKLIKERYAPLVKDLKLSPEDIDKFNQVISDSWLRFTDLASAATQGNGDRSELFKTASGVKTEFDAQLQSLLGDAGYAQYNEYNRSFPAQTTVNLLDQQLGDSGLNADQQARLMQIVEAEPYTSTHGIAGELDVAFFGSQADIDEHLQAVRASDQHILDQAASLLNPQQLAALATLQTSSLAAQKVQGAALAQTH